MVFVIGPVAVGVTVILICTSVKLPSDSTWHVTTPVENEHLPGVLVAETKVTFEGSVSVKLKLVASSGPALNTSAPYAKLNPPPNFATEGPHGRYPDPLRKLGSHSEKQAAHLLGGSRATRSSSLSPFKSCTAMIFGRAAVGKGPAKVSLPLPK